MKSFYFVLAILFAIGELGIFLGFSISDNPTGLTRTKLAPIVTDNNNPNSTAFDYYSDDFNADNC